MSFTLLSRLTLYSSLVMMLLLPNNAVASLPPLDPERYPPEPPPPSSGGFDRGCLPGDQFPERFALVPESYDFGGLTQSEQPTLWFHLPVDLAGAPEENKTITLRLYSPPQSDSAAQEPVQIEHIITPMPTLQAGIVGISLKGSGTRLTMDDLLFWEVAIHCGGPLDLVDSIRPPATTGWIRRVSPVSDQIALADADAVVALSQLYLENGLWYDAISALSRPVMEGSHTSEIRTAWRQLLMDGEIEGVIDEMTVQVIEIGH